MYTHGSACTLTHFEGYLINRGFFFFFSFFRFWFLKLDTPEAGKEAEGKEQKGGERKKERKDRTEGKKRTECLQRKKNIWMNRSWTDIILDGGILGIFTFQVTNFCHGCIFCNKQVGLCHKKYMRNCGTELLPERNNAWPLSALFSMMPSAFLEKEQ